MSKKNIIQESIQDVTVSIQDEIASKAVRKSTLKSIKEKKKARLKQLKTDYEKAVQDIHLQYAQNPDRLKAKYAAAEYAKEKTIPLILETPDKEISHMEDLKRVKSWFNN